MREPVLSQEAKDALDKRLTSLYQAEVPKGWEASWRAAVRREERIPKKAQWLRKSWQIALPTLAALVLVVTLMTGGGKPQEPAARQAKVQRDTAVTARMAEKSQVMLAVVEAPVQGEEAAADGSLAGFGASPPESALESKAVSAPEAVSMQAPAIAQEAAPAQEETSARPGNLPLVLIAEGLVLAFSLFWCFRAWRKRKTTHPKTKEPEEE